jgi:hypothetical protein
MAAACQGVSKSSSHLKGPMQKCRHHQYMGLMTDSCVTRRLCATEKLTREARGKLKMNGVLHYASFDE